MNKGKVLFIGIAISFIYFLIQLVIINDYGLSWDYYFHYYGGLHHLGFKVPSVRESPPVPFTPPDPRLTIDDPFGPIMSIIPVISQIAVGDKLRLFPFDSAYNLPSVIYGSLGVGILFIFLYQTMGIGVAFFSSLFLALLPNYFGYTHTNMKDIPSAVLYAISIYLFWNLVDKPIVKNLILAAVSFGIAFNIKINAITIPVVNFLWFIGGRGVKVIRGTMDKRRLLPWVYFILAPLAATIIWWPFWKDPIGKLLEIPQTFSVNTYNLPVLFFGKIYRSGIDIPFSYPYLYLAITTPLPILFAFMIGMVVLIARVIRGIRGIGEKKGINLLLLLWFFVPLIRFWLPNVSAIDGVRHFAEVIFPLCALAGVGIAYIYAQITKMRYGQILFTGIAVVSFGSLLWNIIHFHPYQTSYFNSLVGGIKGANGKFDIDFWGTPQKEAMLWLNKNAPFNSYVNVVMAQSSAGMYARADILRNLNKKNIWESDYVIVLNRQSFWTWDTISFVQKQDKEKKAIYKKSIDNVPLVWIYKK